MGTCVLQRRHSHHAAELYTVFSFVDSIFIHFASVLFCFLLKDLYLHLVPPPSAWHEGGANRSRLLGTSPVSFDRVTLAVPGLMLLRFTSFATHQSSLNKPQKATAPLAESIGMLDFDPHPRTVASSHLTKPSTPYHSQRARERIGWISCVTSCIPQYLLSALDIHTLRPLRSAPPAYTVPPVPWPPICSR